MLLHLLLQAALQGIFVYMVFCMCVITPRKIYRSRIAESKGTKLFSREASLLKPSAALGYEGAFHQTLTNTVLSSVLISVDFTREKLNLLVFICISLMRNMSSI